MTDSQFWRNMESRFRSIPDPHGMLRADWDYTIGSGTSGLWRLCGGAGQSVSTRFEALARLAGAAIDNDAIPDALEAWLHQLKEESRAFKINLPPPPEVRADIIDGSWISGTIWRVCEASADYCAVLESRAFQLESAKRGEVSESDPPHQPAATTPPNTSRENGPNARVTFILPILDRKGWSKLDWALESQVDYHTVNDYLNGTTKPYRSTLKKLADSLGVTVEDLPK